MMITCPQCATQNPAENKYCLQCAAVLALTCAQCGAPAPAGSKYCGQCRAALPVQPTTVPRLPTSFTARGAAPAIRSGERREVTVLFLDFANFTHFAHGQDAENVFLMVDEVMKQLVDIVNRYEGEVDKFTGDGLMALFGAKQGHENDPERAIRAALDIQERLLPLQSRIQERFAYPLQMRIGIHTGIVISGEIGNQVHVERTVIGDTVNTAARLEAAAAPDTILVSHVTYQRTSAIFHFETLTPLMFKGKPDPFKVYRPLRLREKPERVRGLPHRPTPHIGRQVSLQSLDKTLAKVRNERRGAVIFIEGEAGIGKSRLVEEFNRRQADSPFPVAMFRASCQTQFRVRPYWVVAEIIRHLLAINETDSPLVQFRKLSTYLENNNLQTASILPFLVYLLDLGEQSVTRIGVERLDPDMVQKSLFGAVRQLFVAEAVQQSTVLVFDDLHWVDSASWELIKFIVLSTSTYPLLIILVARNDQRRYQSQMAIIIDQKGIIGEFLQLQNLSSDESYQLLDSLLATLDTQTVDIKSQIVARAEGNPFFTEEIVRMLLEEGGVEEVANKTLTTPLAQALLKKVPSTIHGLIMARFDNLERSMQQTLRRAAVIGDSFPAALFQHLTDLPAETVRDHLTGLANRQFLLLQEGSGESEIYTFRHILIQETIYDTLLKRQRAEFHGEIAETIERHPEIFDGNSMELLAFHFSRSLTPHKGIPFLFHIAAEAERKYANEASADYYRQVITLLSGNQPTLRLLQAKIGLGRSLKLLGQHEEAIAELIDAQQIGSSDTLSLDNSSSVYLQADILHERADVFQRMGLYDEAMGELHQALTLLENQTTAETTSLRHRVIERLVFVHFRLGQLKDAQILAQQVVGSDYLNEDLSVRANLFNHLGGIAWQQGDGQMAIFYVERSQKIYQEMGYSWGIANCLNNLGILHAQSGEWGNAVGKWLQAIDLYERQGDDHKRSLGLSNLAQMNLNLGQHEQARQNALEGLRLAENLRNQYQQVKLVLILAQIELVEQHLAAASQQVKRAQELARETKSEDLQVEVMWMEALILGRREHIKAGLDLIKVALDSARQLGILEREAQCLYVAGVLHTTAGDHLQAETYLTTAEKLFGELHDTFWRGRVLLALGRLFFAQVDRKSSSSFNRAKELLLEAANLFKGLGADFEQQQTEIALHELTLLEDVTTRTHTRDPGSLPSADRRRAAILWVDLNLPPLLDDEDRFELLTLFIPASMTILQEHGGLVQQHGDSLLALFGVPIAYEDDDERAALAAYHLRAYWQQPENQLFSPVGLSLAIGEGALIAGKRPAEAYNEFLIEGTIQQQIKELANLTPDGAIWVTDFIHRRTEHQFNFQAHSPVELMESPVWELVGLRGKIAPARGLPGQQARLIGREESLNTLTDMVRQLEKGIGGIVWLEGEAGIGKTRLMQELQSVLAREDIEVWQGGCLPHKTSRAFALFSDVLAGLFDLQTTDSPLEVRRKIKAHCTVWPAEIASATPFLELIAGIDPPLIEETRFRELKPEQIRQQTFVTFRRILRTLAGRRPLVLALDDLHWIDPISAELLLFLATMAATDPILFVCGQRREGNDAPNDRLLRLQTLLPGQTQRLLLRQLSLKESDDLLDDLLPGIDLPLILRQKILRHGNGNPYFVEEYVRMLIEHGVVRREGEQWRYTAEVDLDELTIPSSLEKLIRSRTDALPETLRHLLSCAAIIGPNFDSQLLQELTGQSQIEANLGRLASRLMIRKKGDEEGWEFVHPLICTVVEETMLRAQRRALHLQLGKLLETRAVSDASISPADLATHFDNAGRPEMALPHLIKAGEMAAGQYANEEAITHFQKAAQNLTMVDDPKAEWRWHIALGLGEIYRLKGQYAQSKAQFESLLPLTEPDEPFCAQRPELLRHLGETTEKQGFFPEARAYLTSALAEVEPENRKDGAAERARILNRLAWIHFVQGELDEARKASEQAIDAAGQTNELNELATAENLLGGIFYHLGDWSAALSHTDQAMAIREKMEDTWNVAGSLSNLGILANAAGEWAQGITYLEQSLALRRDLGDIDGVVISHHNLGEAYRDMGELNKAAAHFRQSMEMGRLLDMSYKICQVAVGLAGTLIELEKLEEAGQVLSAALEQAATLDSQENLAELYMVQAEWYLASGNCSGARPWAEKGIELARQSDNRRLRAAASRIAAATARCQGDTQTALALIEEARLMASGLSRSVEAGHVEAEAFKLFQQLEQPQLAAKAYQQAVVVFSELGANLSLEKLSHAAASFA